MSWLAVLTLVWLVVAALALQAHQHGSARSARRWTTRLYAVTLVPLTALVVGVALVAVQLPSIDVEDPTAVDAAVGAARPYAQWLALAVNLVVVDIVLRRREVAGGHRARQTPARTWSTSTSGRDLPVPGRPLPRTVPSAAGARR